jgi:hypothetical protein
MTKGELKSEGHGRTLSEHQTLPPFPWRLGHGKTGVRGPHDCPWREDSRYHLSELIPSGTFGKCTCPPAPRCMKITSAL